MVRCQRLPRQPEFGTLVQRLHLVTISPAIYPEIVPLVEHAFDVPLGLHAGTASRPMLADVCRQTKSQLVRVQHTQRAGRSFVGISTGANRKCIMVMIAPVRSLRVVATRLTLMPCCSFALLGCQNIHLSSP